MVSLDLTGLEEVQLEGGDPLAKDRLEDKGVNSELDPYYRNFFAPSTPVSCGRFQSCKHASNREKL